MLVGMNELISEQVPMKTAVKLSNSNEYDLTEEELENGSVSGSKDSGIAEPQAKSCHDIGDHKHGFEKHHRLCQFEKQHEENHPSREKGNVKRNYMTHSKHTQTTVEAVQHTSKKINKESGTKPDSAEKSQNLDKHLRNNNKNEIHLVKAHKNEGGSESTDIAKMLKKKQTENEIKLSKRSIEMPGQSKGHQREHMMEHEVKPDDKEQKAGNPNEDSTDKRNASDALASERKISDIAILLKQDLKEHQSESSEAAATDGSKSSVALKHPARLIKPVPLIKLSRDVAPSHVHIVDQAEPAIMKMDISHDSDTAEKIQHSKTTSSVAPTNGFNQVERMSSPEEQTADVSLKGNCMQTKKTTLKSVRQQLLHKNHEKVKGKSDREGLGNETEEEEGEEEEEEEETPAKIKITEIEEIPPQASDILRDLQNGGSGQDRFAHGDQQKINTDVKPSMHTE